MARCTHLFLFVGEVRLSLPQQLLIHHQPLILAALSVLLMFLFVFMIIIMIIILPLCPNYLWFLRFTCQ